MHFKITSVICFSLDRSEMLLFGNGLKLGKAAQVFEGDIVTT